MSWVASPEEIENIAASEKKIEGYTTMSGSHWSSLEKSEMAQ